jgi:hypothetical protein
LLSQLLLLLLLLLLLFQFQSYLPFSLLTNV